VHYDAPWSRLGVYGHQAADRIRYAIFGRYHRLNDDVLKLTGEFRSTGLSILTSDFEEDDLSSLTSRSIDDFK